MSPSFGGRLLGALAGEAVPQAAPEPSTAFRDFMTRVLPEAHNWLLATDGGAPWQGDYRQQAERYARLAAEVDLAGDDEQALRVVLAAAARAGTDVNGAAR